MAIPNPHQIYQSSTKTLYDYLDQGNQTGIYIPPFQRSYSWGRDNIERLFEDIIQGLQNLKSRPNTLTFLGTILAVDDTTNRFVYPVMQGELPDKVLSVVDGQQRLATMLMTNITLHDRIRRLVKSLADTSDPCIEWLTRQGQTVLGNLEGTFIIRRNTGDESTSLYPRMIRAHDDTWSTKGGEKYSSPIARLIKEYSEYYKGDASPTLGGEFRYKGEDSDNRVIEEHQFLVSAFRIIQTELRRICHTHPHTYDFPDLALVVSQLGDHIFRSGITEPGVEEFFQRAPDSVANYDRAARLFRYIIFAEYSRHRVVITDVLATDEDEAFDVFEALNTTGELLTAFETFKPKVVQAELEAADEGDSAPYLGSDSYKSIEITEKYLAGFTEPKDKDSSTSSLLTSFALSEVGERIGEKKNAQRRFLRKQYSDLAELENPNERPVQNRREFVDALSGVSRFYASGWGGSGDEVPFSALSLDEETKVCFQYLRDTRHGLTIPPLSRFYKEVLDAQGADRDGKSTTKNE